MKNLILAIIAMALVGAIAVQFVSAGTVLFVKKNVLQEWRWTSNNPSVLSVDPNTGKLYPLWTGTAEICAALKTNLSQKFCTDIQVVN